MCVRVAHSVSHRLVMSHGGAGGAVSHPDPGGPAWVLTDASPIVFSALSSSGIAHSDRQFTPRTH